MASSVESQRYLVEKLIFRDLRNDVKRSRQAGTISVSHLVEKHTCRDLKNVEAYSRLTVALSVYIICWLMGSKGLESKT